MTTVIYRNLQAGRPNWSRAELRGNVSRGGLLDRADSYAMTDVTFHAIKGTADTIRHKYQTTGKRDRSVHAWSIGTLINAAPRGNYTEVTYNPYRRSDFHLRDGRTVTYADAVIFAKDGKAYAINPR